MKTWERATLGACVGAVLALILIFVILVAVYDDVPSDWHFPTWLALWGVV